MSSLLDIDHDSLSQVFSFCDLISLYNLSRIDVCLPIVAPLINQRVQLMDGNTLTSVVCDAAKQDQREFCQWILSTNKSFSHISDKNACVRCSALSTAARFGHMELCRLLWELPNEKTVRGVDGRHTIYASLTCWVPSSMVGEDRSHNHRHYSSRNSVLYQGALGGHTQVCQLAKSWGANDYDLMLVAATEAGCSALCQLAKEWGAKSFDDMLQRAALSGHEHLCHLAKSWGATDFTMMLCNAAASGHTDLCRLAKEWGARYTGDALAYAVKNERHETIALLHSWPPVRNASCLRSQTYIRDLTTLPRGRDARVTKEFPIEI
jgi:hypothetical protein